MPADPPRDASGNVVPHDHDEIPNHYHVIRRTTPNDLCQNTDTGQRRLASGAFCESTEGGMSVDIEELMVADGLDPLAHITDSSFGAVRITVGELRALGMKVGWDPIEGNRHHGEVWGISNSRRRRKVAAIATTVRKAKGEG